MLEWLENNKKNESFDQSNNSSKSINSTFVCDPVPGKPRYPFLAKWHLWFLVITLAMLGVILTASFIYYLCLATFFIQWSDWKFSIRFSRVSEFLLNYLRQFNSILCAWRVWRVKSDNGQNQRSNLGSQDSFANNASTSL